MSPTGLPDADDWTLANSLPPIEVLAATIYGEARNQGLAGMAAVGFVVMNRAEAGRYGEGVKGVCFRPWQFSCWNRKGGADNYAETMRAVNSLLAGDIGNPVLRECFWVAHGVYQRHLIDRTRGATHYLTDHLYRTNPPRWVEQMAMRAIIGDHVFLREDPPCNG